MLRGEQINSFLLTPEIMAVRKWQADPSQRPLTCGNDSSHGALVPSVDAHETLVLVCRSCEYFQRDVPGAVFTHGDK